VPKLAAVGIKLTNMRNAAACRATQRQSGRPSFLGPKYSLLFDLGDISVLNRSSFGRQWTSSVTGSEPRGNEFSPDCSGPFLRRCQ
jgi:hypothetical protein